MQAYITGRRRRPDGSTGSLPAPARRPLAVHDRLLRGSGRHLDHHRSRQGRAGQRQRHLRCRRSPATAPAGLTFNANGTFTYASASSTDLPGTFSYCGNGATSGRRLHDRDPCGAAQARAWLPRRRPTTIQFISNVATRYSSPPPGVLAGVSNPSGLALTAVGARSERRRLVHSRRARRRLLDRVDPAAPAGATCVTIPYSAKNAQGTASNTADATVIFLPGIEPRRQRLGRTEHGPRQDSRGHHRLPLDHRGGPDLLDRSQVPDQHPVTRPIRRPTCPPLPVESLGYNFHTANMPVVAQGCVGPVSCEAGQTLRAARRRSRATSATAIADTDQTAEGSNCSRARCYLDPNKRYFISILPGDGVNPTIGGAGGPDDNGKPVQHRQGLRRLRPAPTGCLGTGWRRCACAATPWAARKSRPVRPSVNIKLQQTPLPTAKIAVFVFQDDNPLNGENDAGGGVDVIAPNEPGLGGFEIKLFDQAGGLGDATGPDHLRHVQPAGVQRTGRQDRPHHRAGRLPDHQARRRAWWE